MKHRVSLQFGDYWPRLHHYTARDFLSTSECYQGHVLPFSVQSRERQWVRFVTLGGDVLIYWCKAKIYKNEQA